VCLKHDEIFDSFLSLPLIYVGKNFLGNLLIIDEVITTQAWELLFIEPVCMVDCVHFFSFVRRSTNRSSAWYLYQQLLFHQRTDHG